MTLPPTRTCGIGKPSNIQGGDDSVAAILKAQNLHQSPFSRLHSQVKCNLGIYHNITIIKMSKHLDIQ